MVDNKNIMTPSDITFDHQHIWHPYTSMTDPLPCYPVIAARGAELHLADGRKIIDGMSSWWAAIHGYNHCLLNRAAQQQLKKMSHVMFGGITHPPAIALCRQLIAMTPPALEQVFLADSGSVAIEVALKMAIQYWQARGQKRQRFLALHQGYHGDTLGAMSVCDPQNSMHSLYHGCLPQHLFAPAPQCKFHQQWDPNDISAFARLIEQYRTDIAAVILEPIVQGAGGMRMYHPIYLRNVRELCDQHQILLIADEIATGFGRTGKLFACEHAEVVPDILCLGKALTGGYMTLSATLTTREIAKTISCGTPGRFMHGPTFMANPLACAVASANLKLLANEAWKQQICNIEAQLQRELRPLADLPSVTEVRVLGAIGVVEMQHAVDIARLQHIFVKQGVWIRPFGKLIYLIPPYMIRSEQLTQLTQAISVAIC